LCGRAALFVERDTEWVSNKETVPHSGTTRHTTRQKERW
jgi:hypothetical protein